MQKHRKLKVYRKFRNRTWDITSVPEIRLAGRWLEQLGFTEGNDIQVEIKKGKLVVSLLKEEEK